jgi:hypothetical protein
VLNAALEGWVGRARGRSGERGKYPRNPEAMDDRSVRIILCKAAKLQH